MTHKLKKEIASAQRLVEKSVQPFNQFARELDIYPQRQAFGPSQNSESMLTSPEMPTPLTRS